MKLWEKGFSVNSLVEEYTTGDDQELDLHLAKHDVIGTMAHVKMLSEIDVISEKENDDIQKELFNILEQIKSGQFTIESHFEDVHSKVEWMLIQNLGETGKKVHTARSRNDQVLLDLHLYTKEELKQTSQLLLGLFDKLLGLAEEHKGVIIPGYTHMQVAMPSSFGMLFSGYAELLLDDLFFIDAAFKVSDQNPLGSAAGFGSSFGIDRNLTTQYLGFSGLKVSSVGAQMSRGRLEKMTVQSLSNVATTLGKFSMDICTYMNENFGFVSFPKELTTGSSIMPHKKNPDVFEIMRARCNKVQGMVSEINFIITNLISGYHRDLQETKSILIDCFDIVQNALSVASFMLEHIEIKQVDLDLELYKYMFSVENVNKLVQKGMSFRDAYQKVGGEIHEGTFESNSDIHHTHIGSIGNLGLELIKEKRDKLLLLSNLTSNDSN